MKNNFWIDNSTDYTELLHVSLKNVLHPIIVKIVNEAKPLKYLDYGCGDGRMTEMIDKEIEVSIFDISEKMIQQAQGRLKARITSIYKDTASIPSNTFDIVVSSLVFVCIDNESDFNLAMQTISGALSANGKAIIALTHPCFRQYTYSDFFTSYSQGKKFNYHRNAEPFEVTIHDNTKEHSVVFNDYHWTLSYTINKMVQSGLSIAKIIETGDDTSDPEYNKQFSPFIILIANKK